MDPAASDLATAIIREAGEDYRARSTFDPNVLLRLEAVFGSALSGALEILDEMGPEERRKRRGRGRGRTGSRTGRRAGLFAESLTESSGVSDSAVVVITAERSGRVLWQVRGSSGIFYPLLPDSNFCPCYSWLYRTWRKADLATCKHVLAARLALACGRFQERTESEDKFVLRVLDAMTRKA